MDETTPLPLLVVRGIVQSPEGKILLTQRGEGHSSPGKWVLPGGKVDCYMSVEEAVIMEVFKETGIRMLDATLLFSQNNFPSSAEPLYVINLYCTGKSYKGQIRKGEDEADVRWVHPFDFGSYDFAFGSREALEKYFNLIQEIN
jgi:8-oxo-dGTP diphosphatase